MTTTNNTQEWMTSSQSKDRFGIGFSRLMKLADNGVVDRRQLDADDNGDVSFIFRVSDVRNFVENSCDGSEG